MLIQQGGKLMYVVYDRQQQGRRILACLMLLTGFALPACAVAQTLDELSYASLPGNRIQLRLGFSAPLQREPGSFVIDNPARIALDFENVSLNLQDKVLDIGVGAVQKVSVVETGQRTRVVVNLLRMVPYRTELRGSTLLLVLGEQGNNFVGVTSPVATMPADIDDKPHISAVDFHRGESGQGMIKINLSSSGSQMNIEQRGLQLQVFFPGLVLPAQLDRRLNVIDFATPVKEIDTRGAGNGVNMVITMNDSQYDYLAYQTDLDITIEVQPLTRGEKEQLEKERFKYTGEKLSLNFQDIEVRAVLQLLAEFTDQNLIVGDTVGGRVTLRLKNVPWDQALDIILSNRGLGKRVEGNVLLVAPVEELAARERQQLESQQQIRELELLQTQYIQINYARAEDLAGLIQDESSSLLSERGKVTVDARTNILIVQDVSDSLEDVRRLINRLDIPVEQVLIESRIVTVDDAFSRQLGVRFGYSRETGLGEGEFVTIGGHKEGNVAFSGFVPQIGEDGSVTFEEEEICTGFCTSDAENYLVSLPVSSGALPGAALGIALGQLGSWLLQLELEALLTEGRGENISSPKVITVNQGEAIIESGTQIPYQEASASGATSTSYIDAVLRLRVVPQITPDDRILLELEVNQDEPGTLVAGGALTVDTNRVSTSVLVDNGETVVLGGIFTHILQDGQSRIPFLSDLPYVGFLFRNSNYSNDKSELLIFVTPRILTSPSAG